MEKANLLQFLTGLLLVTILSGGRIQSLSAQEISRSQQIAVNSNTGFYGKTIIGKCSSRQLELNIHLSLQWYAREGTGEDAPLVSLGGCMTTEPGFPSISCNNKSVTATELYENGNPAYTVSTITYKTSDTVTALVCVLGNNQSLEVSLDLRPPLRVVNIKILCQNCPAILSWETQGAADFYRVNFGDGNWHVTSQQSIAYPVTRNLIENTIKIQGVSNRYGRGSVGRFTPRDQPLAETSLHTGSQSCTVVEFYYNTLNLKPIYLTLSAGDYRYPEALLSESGEATIDLQNVPSGYSIPDAVRASLSWGCVLMDTGGSGNCAQEKTTLIRSSSRNIENAFRYGPEKITSGCLQDGMTGDVLLDVHWEHLLNNGLIFSGQSRNFAYHIETIDDEGFAVNNTVPIDTSRYIVDGHNTQFSSLLPQSITLTLHRGHTYQLSITPNYLNPVIPDPLCISQTLTHEFIIPVPTEVTPLDETSAGVQCIGFGSGCHVAIFINDTNEKSSEPKTLLSEYFDATGEQNIVINTLTANQNYTIEVTYNGTDSVPCRKDVVTLSLTPAPSSASESPDIYPSTTIQAPLPSSVDRSTTSINLVLPTTIATEAIPENVHPTEPGNKDNYLPLYIASGEWVLIVIALIPSITLCICLRQIKK